MSEGYGLLVEIHNEGVRSGIIINTAYVHTMMLYGNLRPVIEYECVYTLILFLFCRGHGCMSLLSRYVEGESSLCSV